MDVKVRSDVRFRRRESLMEMVSIQDPDIGGAMAEAYRIVNNLSYTLDLKPDNDPCANDNWSFKLANGVYDEETCDKEAEHRHIMGRPRLTVSTTNTALNGYGLDSVVMTAGNLDNVTINVGVGKLSGCKFCDVLFLRVDYYSCLCNGNVHHFKFVPLALNNQEVRGTQLEKRFSLP